MSQNPHYEGAKVSMKGKNEARVSAINLSYVWGNDRRYWKIPTTNEGPAELLQVSWLEVTGCVEDIDPEKSYEVKFHLSLTPDAFGWSSDYPLYVMTKRGMEGKPSWRKKFIDEKSLEFVIIGKAVKQPKDGNATRLYFGLYEVWSGKWKGGLKIKHVLVKEAD